MKKNKFELDYYKKLERAIELITKFNLTKDDMNCLAWFSINTFLTNFADYCKKEELKKEEKVKT